MMAASVLSFKLLLLLLSPVTPLLARAFDSCEIALPAAWSTAFRLACACSSVISRDLPAAAAGIVQQQRATAARRNPTGCRAAALLVRVIISRCSAPPKSLSREVPDKVCPRLSPWAAMHSGASAVAMHSGQALN